MKPRNEKEAIAYVMRMEKRDKLWNEVMDLYEKCEMFDEAIRNFFSISSRRMLVKKKKVLQEVIDGKSPDEIGKDYWDILELFDKSEVEDGHICIVGGWKYDPAKYK